MANSLVQNTYLSSSSDDDNDALFDNFDFETVPTQPLQRPLKPGIQPESNRHITQPTQPLDLTTRQRQTTSPTPSEIQVTASSPLQAPYRPSPSGPRQTPVPRGALNGGILAHAMAPPGTQFRSPFQPQMTNHDRDARSQTVELNFSDDDQQATDSSDNDDSRQPAAIKRSVFMKDGKPVDSTGQPLRIEESPQSASFAKFRYNGLPVPQSRSADVIANAYSTTRKPKPPPPRESAPNVRLVELPDMSLDDVTDWNTKSKIKIMRDALGSNVTIRQCNNALVKKRFNVSDAMEYLTDEIDREEENSQNQKSSKGPPADLIDLSNLSEGDELIPASPAYSMPKQGVKRDVKNVKSITEKWSTAQNRKRPSDERPITPPPKKPKRRLLRPPQPESSPVQTSTPRVAAPPSRELSPTAVQLQKPKPSPAQKIITIESDADEGVQLASDDDDTNSSADEPVDHSASESKLLKFLNNCTPEALLEISNQPQNIISHVLANRPFQSLDAVRSICTESTGTTKSGKTRTLTKQIGDRFVDICLDVLEGYEAVDDLVTECEVLGRPVRNDMERFGFFDNAQGELQVVDLESVDRDSGIGTPIPSSSAASVDEDFESKVARPQKKTTKKRNSSLLTQPALMSKTCTLKDYQVTGLNWLALLFANKMSGILADDMGLGKTIQVIAFLAHLCESGTKGPHLVIVPGSTLENWLREFQNFCPNLPVEPYYGSQSERAELQVQITDQLEAGEVSVIVTTYDMAVSPSDAKFLRKMQPTVCVYDEGHTLKNSRTKRYTQLMRIPAQFRLLLTGTPLQNNLQELMALLGFIMPEVFQKHQEQLEIIFKHKAKASGGDDTGKAALLSAQRISRARSMIKPFILRRKKEQVLKHLPQKTCHVVYCELSLAQKSIYQGEVDKVKQALLERSAAQDGAASVTTKTKANILMELRKAAIHPLLFRRHYDDALLRKMSTACLEEPEFSLSDPQLVWEDFGVMTDFEINRFCHRYPATMIDFALQDNPAPCLDSGKVAKLVELLKSHEKNKDRTLVFSQFTMVMDILEEVFETENISFSRLDGATKMQERQDLIDQFTEDKSISVFMLSTKAGGAGINLACANKVIIFDSSFNPQDDIQAENRAHRVGQEREVEVVRLVVKDTIEEQIYELGKTKLVLDERVAGDAGSDPKVGEAVEQEGMDLVARMMKERLDVGSKEPDSSLKQSPDHSDLKDAYLTGLQEAGLNVAA